MTQEVRLILEVNLHNHNYAATATIIAKHPHKGHAVALNGIIIRSQNLYTHVCLQSLAHSSKYCGVGPPDLWQIQLSLKCLFFFTSKLN